MMAHRRAAICREIGSWGFPGTTVIVDHDGRLLPAPGGQVVYKLRRPRPHAQEASLLVIDPLDFLRRLLQAEALSRPRSSTRAQDVPMVVLAFLTDPEVVGKILTHLGLSTTAPTLTPARPSAQPLRLDLPQDRLMTRPGSATGPGSPHGIWPMPRLSSRQHELDPACLASHPRLAEIEPGRHLPALIIASVPRDVVIAGGKPTTD
jgi:hypothetical protein